MRDSEALGDHISKLDDLALKELAKHTGGNYFWLPQKYDWLDQMLYGTGERVKVGEGSIYRPYENRENY